MKGAVRRMMKFNLRQTACVFLLMTFIFTVFGQDVTFANDNNERPPVPTEGTPAEDPNYGTSSQNIDLLLTKYISSANCSIRNLGAGRVNVSGYTSSHSTVDIIRVNLYLQIWDPYENKWRDLRSVGKFEKSNTSYVSGSSNLTASRGNQYRTRSVHYIKKGSTIENITQISDYIYIN